VTRELPPEIETLLYDPQTSGGLLISASEPRANAMLRNLEYGYRIGRVVERQACPIRLV
jgi:selenophosphate synthase